VNVIRLGIAGLGQAGAAIVPAIARNPAFSITAAADPRADATAAFQRDTGAATHADVEQLCGDPAVDAVYIATPTHLHARHTLAAIAAGKHVLVEKPLATSLEDAAAMVEAAAAARMQLVVGHSHSFEPPIRAMRELVVGGSLGRLAMVHTWNYTDWLERPRLAEELDTSLGGGVLFRQGAHQADILRWVGGGLVRSVRANVTASGDARRTEGGHTIFLEFESGAAATAVYSGFGHLDARELTGGIGEDGRAHMRRPAPPASGRGGENPEEADVASLKAGRGYTGRPLPEPTHAATFGLTIASCEGGDIRQSPAGLLVHTGEGTQEIAIPALPAGRDILLEEFHEAIATGRPAPHDGRWGLANLEVCVAVLESARSRREVLLRHQVPVPPRQR
jgi:phthalate 4,5-cis-dihydrodiol dehydrogenase